MILEKFIAAHEILHVGIALPGYLYVDLIVDDSAGLVHQVADSEFYISRINWWELASIAAGSALGMGGPRDPRAPEEYFFSEVTHMGKTFDSSSCVEDYLSYIENVKSKYPHLCLFPSFDITITNVYH